MKMIKKTLFNEIPTEVGGDKDCYIMAIESSCDETACAIVKNGNTDVSTLKVKIDGIESTIYVSDAANGIYYVELAKMSANSFANTHKAEIFIDDVSINQILNYSMNTYVNRIVENEKVDQIFKDLAKRLYYYGQSAKAYSTAQ